MHSYVQTRFAVGRNASGGGGGAEEHRHGGDTAVRASACSDSLNQSPQAESLLQMRNALDDGPRVKSQLTLQRALNRRWTGPALADRAEDSKCPTPRHPNATGLPDGLKAGIEQLSGFALDDVRVHYNSTKPAQLQAWAYTQGSDIHVAPGQQRHLPHESWHVVQQKQGRVTPTLRVNGVAINDEKFLEDEADRYSRIISRPPASARTDAPPISHLGSQSHVLPGSGATVQRMTPAFPNKKQKFSNDTSHTTTNNNNNTTNTSSTVPTYIYNNNNNNNNNIGSSPMDTSSTSSSAPPVLMPMPVNSPLGSRNTHPGVNPYINTNFVHYGKSSSNSNNTNNNIIISPSSPSSVTPSSKINHYRSNNSKSSSTKFNNTNNNNTSSISSSPSVAPSNKINHHFSNNNNFKNTNNNTNNNTNTISTSSSSHVSLEDAYKNWDPSRKGAITIATSYGPVQAFHNRGAPKISSNKKDYNGAVLKNKNDPKDKGDSYESYVQGLKSGTASDHEIAQSLLNKDTRSIQTGTQQRAAANLEGTVFLAERSRKEKAHKLFRYHLKQVAGEKRTLEEALLQDYSFAQKDHGADLGRRQLGRIDDLRHSPNKDALRKKASKSDVEIADGISDGESSTDDELREKKSLKSQQRLYSEKYDKAEKQRVAEYRKENAAKNNKKPRAKNNNKKPRANNNNNNNNNNNTLDKYMFTSQTPVNTPAKVMQSPSASLNNNNNTKPNKTLPNDTSSISNPVMANWLDTYKPQPPSSQSSSSSASKVNNQNLVYQQQGKSSSSSSSISKTTMPVSSTSRFNMNSSYSTSSSTHLPSTFLVNNPNNINNINNPGNLLFSNTLSLTGSSPQSNSAQASLFNQQGVRQFQAHSQNSSARKNSSTNNSKKEKEKD